MKKFLYMMGVFVLGAMVVTLLDNAIGVRVDGNSIAVIAHKVVHMAWGGVLVAVFREKDGGQDQDVDGWDG